MGSNGHVHTHNHLSGVKTGAALLSVFSNLGLIVLKVVAGVVTGSVAILTEAVHSTIDLAASVMAYYSVRKADEPADDRHRYGHGKVENLTAAVEGLLIVIGVFIIIFESVRRLLSDATIDDPQVGIVIIAFSIAVNFVVSRTVARRARETDSPALASDAAHLHADMLTSLAVIVGLILVHFTGINAFDAIAALAVAAFILATGVRIIRHSSQALIDEALPEEEVQLIKSVITRHSDIGVLGFHKLRTRKAGSCRYIDLHVQFRAGTTLEDAHETGHLLQREIEKELLNADVLIHIEPETSLRA